MRVTKIVGVGAVALALLAACGDDNTTATTTPPSSVTVATSGDSRPTEVPAEATPVDTPEGRVWVWVDNAMVYGPCKIVDKYKDGRLHELVGMDPPEGLADFGFQCWSP